MIEISELLALVGAAQVGETGAMAAALKRLDPVISAELRRAPADRRDDCRQAAIAGCSSHSFGGAIRAIETYDPTLGPLLAHVRRHVALAIRDELAKMSCPVSYLSKIRRAKVAGEVPCQSAMRVSRDTSDSAEQLCTRDARLETRDIARRALIVLSALPARWREDHRGNLRGSGSA